MNYGTDYLTIICDKTILRQRTPNSKFVEFTLNGIKLNTYEELPKEIQEIVDLNKDFEKNPDDHFQFEITERGIIINKFLSPCKYIKVPEFINELPVIGIGKEVMCYSGGLIEQIQLPDTIEFFEQFAFSNGENLKHINIPNNVTELPPYCFFNTVITEIDLNNVKTIRQRAFQNCFKLKSIDLTNIEELGERVFINCSILQNVTLPLLREIPVGTFTECLSLEEIKIPESVHTIKKLAFSGCEKLKRINFPKNLKRIETKAFNCCTSLNEFIAPKYLFYIEAGAFNFSDLNKIILNKGLKKVENSAFYMTSAHEIDEVFIDKDTIYCGDSFSSVKKFKVTGIEEKEQER